MAVMAKSAVIRDFVVVFIAVYMVYGELALVLWEEVAVFAILFLVK